MMSNKLIPKKGGELAVQRGNDLVNLTCKLLQSRHMLSDESWMQELWDWADKYYIELPRTREGLLSISILLIDGMSELNRDLNYENPIDEIPSALGKLTSLTSLTISGCEYLTTLPDCLWQLANLTTLIITGCNILPDLPDNLCKLTNLITLDLSGLGIAALPE